MDGRLLDVGVCGGIEEVQRWLADGPDGLSVSQRDDALDRLQAEVRSNTEALAREAVAGALVVAEVLTGLVLAVVLLLFFLTDGSGMWRWLASLAPPGRREAVREADERAREALRGVLRGQTVVHAAGILLGITTGAVPAGTIGAMVAAPVIAAGGAILRFLREG